MPDSTESSTTVWSRFKSQFSAPGEYAELNILEAVRSIHPNKSITVVATPQADLVKFASAGHATAILIRDRDEFLAQAYYIPPESRLIDKDGVIMEKVKFGLYDYTFDQLTCLVYVAEWRTNFGTVLLQYIVSDTESNSATSVATLIKKAGKWSSELHEEIYVFDSGHWQKNKKLWEAVQSAFWDDVILEPTMKKTLIADVEDFFDSRSVYEEYSVPWKRGIIFHGTPGCGKTISIKALMNTLQSRNVASLYVKSFDACEGPQYSIRSIFQQARVMAPCMLIFEDLDSLVVDKVRSYFLNEVDGLEENNGILLIGSTNHLDRLDPGISKRPSRFDRKYHYKLPGEKERLLYCEYWRQKLLKSSGKLESLFEEDICAVVAQLTEGFSFAYLKELFVQTLLAIVGGRGEDDDEEEAITTAAEEATVLEGSAKLAHEGDALSTESEGASSEALPPRTMPPVQIPQPLEQNSLMRILYKQAKALWKEMDNSEFVHGREKVAGEGNAGMRGRRAVKARMQR